MTPTTPQHQADWLYAALKGDPSEAGRLQPAEIPAAGLPEAELPAAELELGRSLQALAQTVRPDPAAKAELRRRLALAQQAAARAAPPARPAGRAALAQAGRFLGWIAMAALLLLGMSWAFQNVLPQVTPAAPASATPVTPTPTGAPRPDETRTPAPDGPTPIPTAAPTAAVYTSRVIDNALGLEAQFPSAPAGVQLYRRSPGELISVEQARRLAGRLGFTGPVYRLPDDQPGAPHYYLTDGVMEIDLGPYAGWFHYRRAHTPAVLAVDSTPPLPAEQLSVRAEDFLQQAGLLDFPYQVQPPHQPGNARVAQTLVSELQDGLPVVFSLYDGTGYWVSFDEQGQVNEVVAKHAVYQPVGEFPIISAQAAWDKLLRQDLASGAEFRSSGSLGVPLPDVNGYRMWQPARTPGRPADVHGFITVYPAAEAGVPPRLTLDGTPLSGQVDQALVEQAARPNPYFHVWGRFESGLGGELQINVAGYEVSTSAYTSLGGTITRQGDDGLLRTVDGREVRIPGLPADVPDDSTLYASGALLESPDGLSMDWSNLANDLGFGGGGGGGIGLAGLNLDGQPTPTPEAQPAEATSSQIQRLDGVEGRLYVTMHRYTDGVMTAEAFLNVDPSPDWPDGLYVRLEGPAVAGSEAYYQLPVKVWGRYELQDGANGAPALQVERMQPVYPDLQPQVWFGSVSVKPVGGRSVLVLTAEDGQAYVINGYAQQDGLSLNQLPWQPGERLAVEGLAIPGEQAGAYPLIRDFYINPYPGKPQAYRPTFLSPNVISEPAASTELKLATIKTAQLVYWTTDPAAAGMMDQPADDVYLQPVWLFWGTYNNGQEFYIVVQALADEYLK
ncbi:MAG: hypothetical protein ACKOC5_16720 [Chloroflexota bacterium]